MSDQDAIALAERCAKAAVRVMERGRLVTIPADKENDVDIVLRDAAREIRRLADLRCEHGWRRSKPDRGERIADKCPSCGLASIFIGSGGWLTCANLSCKEPGIMRSLAAAVAAAYEHAAKACRDVRDAAQSFSHESTCFSTRLNVDRFEGARAAAIKCEEAIRALIPKPTPSFDIWEGRGELPGLKPKPTPQHEHTDTCFGPNYSHCPVASATSDEERERFRQIIGMIDKGPAGYAMHDLHEVATDMLAMLEADGKRIAELESENKRLVARLFDIAPGKSNV